MRPLCLLNKITEVLLHLSYAHVCDMYVHGPIHECGLRHCNTCDGQRTILDVVPHILSCLRLSLLFV